MAPRRLAAVVLAAVLLAACGDGDGDGVGAGGGAPSSTAGATTTTAEPFEGATTPTSVPSEASGVALLTDVRVAHHPGFDRVVFEFRGDGPPGVDARYVEAPVREDGSGNEVAVEGEAFLQVRMEPASGVQLEGERPVLTYEGPDRIDGGVPAIAEIVETGDFEANLTWTLGLTGEAEYRVLALSSPARVVVDVRSTG